VPPVGTGAPIAPHAASVASCDRHAELMTPELIDLREASRTDGAGISRPESAFRASTRSSTQRGRPLSVTVSVRPMALAGVLAGLRH
jgi:hypothetical protein